MCYVPTNKQQILAYIAILLILHIMWYELLFNKIFELTSHAYFTPIWNNK